MKRKKTYLLLELLIAFALVGICALFLMGNPLKAVQGEIGELERMELERLAEVEVALFKTEMISDKIKWKEIPEKGEQRTFMKGR